MLSIFNKLMGRKAAADYDALIPEIEASIKTAQERAIALRAKLPGLAFEKGPDEVKKLRAELREVEDEIDTLQGIAAEAEKRRAAAEADELKAIVLERMSGAEKDFDHLDELWAEFDRRLDLLRELIPEIQQHSERVRVGNEFARVNGFSHLQLRLPGFSGEGFAGIFGQLRQMSHSSMFKTLKATNRRHVG